MGDAPRSAISAFASSSSSRPVTPGAIASRSSRRTSAFSLPASRMIASSSGDLMTTDIDLCYAFSAGPDTRRSSASSRP